MKHNQTEEAYWSRIKKERDAEKQQESAYKHAAHLKEIASLERFQALKKRLEKNGRKFRSYKRMPIISENLYKLFWTIAMNNSKFKPLDLKILRSTFENLSKRKIGDRQFKRYLKQLKEDCQKDLIFENSKGGRGKKLLISRKVVEKKKSVKGDIINNMLLFNRKAPGTFKDPKAVCRWILSKVSKDFTENKKVFIDFALLKEMILKFLKLKVPIWKILQNIIKFSWLKSFKKKLNISPKFHFWKIRDKMYKLLLSEGLCTKEQLSKKREIMEKCDEQYIEMIKKCTDDQIANAKISDEEWNECASAEDVIIPEKDPNYFERGKAGLPILPDISDKELFASMRLA